MNCLLGFSPDGQSLVIAEGLANHRHATDETYLLYRDTRTGNIFRRVDIKLPVGRHIHQMKMSKDCQRLFIQTAAAYGGTTEDPGFNGESSLFIFDLATGKEVNQVAHFGFYVGVQPSSNGHWYWQFNEDKSGTHLSVCQSLGNQPAFRRATTQSNAIVDAIFSDDETKLVLLQTTMAEGQFLQILELATGRENTQASLPQNQKFSHIARWEGDSIYLQTEKPSEAPGGGFGGGPQAVDERSSIFRFDVASNKLNNGHVEKLMDTYFSDLGSTNCTLGRDWILFEQRRFKIKPAWMNSALSWIDKKFGSSWLEKYSQRMTISILDRSTGNERFILSVQRNSSYILSASGDALAVSHNNHNNSELQLWNAHPLPRWPWALACSLLPVVIALFFRRYRSKVQTTRR